MMGEKGDSKVCRVPYINAQDNTIRKHKDICFLLTIFC